MKFLIFFSLIVLATACKNKENEVYNDKLASDSLSFYLDKANKSYVLDEKVKNLDRSYSLITKVKNTKKNRDTLFNILFNYYNLK